MSAVDVCGQPYRAVLPGAVTADLFNRLEYLFDRLRFLFDRAETDELDDAPSMWLCVPSLGDQTG